MYRDSTIASAHHDCKYRAIPSLHRDYSLAKVPGQVPGASPDASVGEGSGNAYYLNCRAVRRNNNRNDKNEYGDIIML
jgi:hypothetical protein